MGRYVPPDQEGISSFNKAAGKHPLGARARHLQTKGALIVRFEMPFAIWCTNCKPRETLIGQGVRFNAEKKKVGNYYSTPIYSFRMKHTVCGGWIEIRTDPKNTAYIVTEGGRKRDTGGEDKDTGGELGEIRINNLYPGGAGGSGGSGVDGKKALADKNDAFARLEGKVEDKRQFDTATTRINELQKRQSRDWDDPYEQSKRLRKTFRTERKRLEKIARGNEALRDKMSLGIDVLKESEEDRLRARLVEFGPASTASGSHALTTNSRTRPMFDDKSVAASRSSDLSNTRRQKEKDEMRISKTKDPAAERKTLLSNELRDNTRAAVDPFLNDDTTTWQPTIFKTRKVHDKPANPATGDLMATDEQARSLATNINSTATDSSVSAGLVDYGSDSE